MAALCEGHCFMGGLLWVPGSIMAYNNHQLKWAQQPPPKISLLVVILKTFTAITHTHTHTHTSSKNDPSLPPLISASLRVLPHLPVLWHVLQVALLDTKESRSHFGVGQSVAHDTSLGYKQVCSHWCIGSSHFTGDLLWHTLLGSEIQQWAGQTVPAFLRL